MRGAFWTDTEGREEKRDRWYVRSGPRATVWFQDGRFCMREKSGGTFLRGAAGPGDIRIRRDAGGRASRERGELQRTSGAAGQRNSGSCRSAKSHAIIPKKHPRSPKQPHTGRKTCLYRDSSGDPEEKARSRRCPAEARVSGAARASLRCAESPRGTFLRAVSQGIRRALRGLPEARKKVSKSPTGLFCSPEGGPCAGSGGPGRRRSACSGREYRHREAAFWRKSVGFLWKSAQNSAKKRGRSGDRPHCHIRTGKRGLERKAVCRTPEQKERQNVYFLTLSIFLESVVIIAPQTDCFNPF